MNPQLADPATPWTALTLLHWYGEGPRAVEVAVETALWSHSSLGLGQRTA